MSVLKSRTIAEPIPISTTLSRRNIKSRTIAQTLAFSTTLTKAAIKKRTISAVLAFSTTLNRTDIKARTIAQTIPISTTLLIGRVIERIINQTIAHSTTLNMVRYKFRRIAENIRLVVVASQTNTARLGWIVSGQSTDFLDKLDNLVKAYVASKWAITVVPQLGADLTATEAQQDNFEYDSFRTYYIQVKEGQSRVVNREIRQRLYEFETPIEFVCTVRSLSKGESFNHLNSMINELLRIFGEFQREEIFGIQGITLESITPIGNDSANKSIFQRTLKIFLHYYKVDNSAL